MRIGTVEISSKLALAPMAGVTDAAFRQICSELGAGYTITELISSKALCYHDKKTFSLLTQFPGEHPAAVQIFGSDPICMAEAAQIAMEYSGADILDINMGCPVPKVVNNGEGSALMKNPQLAHDILAAMVKAVKIPVTVKFRAGWDDANRNAVEVARAVEAAGVSAVAVHGRTRQQFYEGKADWSIIADVKQAVKVPVFGNGDIFTVADGLRMLEQTGCDGFMIARGAQGNPWIFSQILHYFETGEHQEKPSFEEVRRMILRHARMMIEFKGEFTGIHEMRKHTAWYTAGYPHSSRLRAAVNTVESLEQLEELLYKEKLQN